MRTPCLFHRTFPQRWKTLNGEGSPSIGSLEPETGGKAGWTIARGFSTPHVAAGVLTHFLLSRALSSNDDHPYTAWPPALPDPASSKDPRHGQGQANVPAEQPPSLEGARLPPSHADAGRPRHRRREAP